MTSLHTRAMLVGLTVHRWTALKFDRTATADFNRLNQAKDAGRYNKLLIDHAHTRELSAAYRELHDFHKELTLPWSDKGYRLLPADLFMQYRDGMRARRNSYDAAADAFEKEYPNIASAARNRLGNLYNPQDYPLAYEIRRRFSVDNEIIQVPKTGTEDFRIMVGEEAAAEIHQNILDSIKARQEQGVQECWDRATELLTRLHTQLRDKGRIYDSTLVALNEFCVLLPSLNVMGDAQLTELAQQLPKVLTYTADQLRSSDGRRHLVRNQIDQILSSRHGQVLAA